MELASIPYQELFTFVFPRLAFARQKIHFSEKIHNRCLVDSFAENSAQDLTKYSSRELNYTLVTWLSTCNLFCRRDFHMKNNNKT